MIFFKYLTMLICVFLLAGCSSIYKDWKHAKGEDTLPAYEKFLEENPKSAFTDLAEERIKELRWVEAQRKNTPEALQRFADTYPDDELAKKARERMQLVEWQEAKELNTPEGYRNFAKKYPHGPTAFEAEQEFRRTASTQLNVAAGKGDVEEVNRLLEMDVDVNKKTSNGTTPLMWASLKGHTAIVQSLLTHGSSVNERTDEGVTALMLASQEGFREIVDPLLDGGADPNIQNIQGETAMDIAARKGHIDILRTLLEISVPAGEKGTPTVSPPSTKILVSGIEQVVRKSAPELRADQELDIDILAVSNYDSVKNHILVFSRVALLHKGRWVPLHSIRHFRLHSLPKGEWKLEMVTNNGSEKPKKEKVTKSS